MGTPEIRDFLARNAGRYTREALRAQLIAAGYSAEEVSAAEAAADAGAVLTRPPLRWLVSLYVLGLVGATILLFALVFEFPYIGGLALPILSASLATVGLLVLWALRRSRAVQMGVASGTAAALLVPFVAVVVVGGICVATTAPRFALPHQRTHDVALGVRDGWDAVAGRRLTELGRLDTLLANDFERLTLPPGAALTVEFASDLPPDALVRVSYLTVAFTTVEPLIESGTEPPHIRIGIGRGDLDDPVVERTERAYVFNPGDREYGAELVLSEGDLVDAVDVGELKVVIEAADEAAELQIDSIVLHITYHRR